MCCPLLGGTRASAPVFGAPVIFVVRRSRSVVIRKIKLLIASLWPYRLLSGSAYSRVHLPRVVGVAGLPQVEYRELGMLTAWFEVCLYGFADD